MYEYKKLSIDYDAAKLRLDTAQGDGIANFYLTETVKEELSLKNSIPCISVFYYVQNGIGMKMIYNNTCRDLKQYMDDLEIINCKLEDEMCDFIYVGTNYNNSIKIRQVIYKNKSHIVSVSCGCNSSDFEKFEPVIDEFIAAVKF